MNSQGRDDEPPTQGAAAATTWEDNIRYAVVTFDDSSAVEAVPIIWLNDTMTKCWWPPKTESKNVSNLIKCAAVPNSASWESHDVSLIKIYDDLSNARSKVDRVVKDLSSDECFGRGQRKVKPKTSGSDQLADIDLHQIPYVVQTSLTIPVATPLTSSTLRAAQVQHAEPPSNPPKTLSASETLIPISTISTDNDVIYEYEVTTPQAITLDDIHKCIKAGFESMLFEFTSINETMKQQTARISELENQFKNFAGPLTPSPPNTGVGDVKGLPLSDIDQIKEFENKLTEAGFYNSVCNKMKLLRGGKFDEFIRRMLAYIFTNNLAALSSWTGIRGSFEIKSLKIILAIEDVARTYHPTITKKEVKDCVALWFRNANQRMKRDHLKQATDE